MICSSLYLLFLMSAILLMSGLHFRYLGTAGGEQVTHVVQSVWDRLQALRADISEPEVVLPMRRLATMWQQLFPVEQCRLAQLLIERVVVADGGLEIVWRDQGWQELAVELMPGTIGAELQELEETT